MIRLDAKQQAKKMVNRIYQPLGHLMCHVSSDIMWKWSKERVKEEISLLLTETKMFQTEFSHELNKNWKYWREVQEAIENLP